MTWPRAPSPMSRKTAAMKPFRSPAAIASCNGSPTWACAGRRWAWITRCTARIIWPRRRSMTRSARSPAATPPEHFMYRAVPGRQGPEDLQVQGQRHHHRRMAGLWLAGKPGAVHVPEAARGQAALFRCDPQGGGRIYRLLDAYHAPETSEEQRLENPVWHIHGGKVPDEHYPVSFALLLNLVSASNAHNRDVLWGFIRAYAPHASPEANPGLDRLVGYALRYYEDFVKPAKRYRARRRQGTRGAGGSGGAAGSAGRRTRRRRWCRMWSTKWARRTASSRCATWFAALYEVLFGPDRRARASALSPPCSAAPRPRA